MSLVIPRSLRRDATLLMIGALIVYFSSIFSPLSTQILINTVSLRAAAPDRTETDVLVQTMTTTVLPEYSVAAPSLSAEKLPETSIVAHAPGWTLFKNLYMSNSTFFIVSDSPFDFPKIRLMASNPLPAENNPRNIAMREPTASDMAILTSAEAQRRWGDDDPLDKKARVSSVDGNMVFLSMNPDSSSGIITTLSRSFFFGVQAFWHGAFSAPSSDPDRAFMLGPHPAPPPIHRIIFARTNAAGWRDDPGFNAYFLRAAFPAATIEVEQDWQDRVSMTTSGDRAWHFPLLLLTDRSASHRGHICGSQTQRIASEAVEAMRFRGQLVGVRVGGVLSPWDTTEQKQLALSGDGATKLPMPAKIVITYISRQNAGHRKLTPESHTALVGALEDVTWRKGWELNVVEAEKLSRDEQLRVIARTTVLLGVHGNGLTHLVMMPPTRISTVIEIFYPRGFAHDYQWTTNALGMKHFAVWNDTYRTEGVGEGKPDYAYPEGFQGNHIPVHGPAVAQLIEERVEGRL
ncbi:hypothetical protein MVEN_00385600 [Mycena venus]|uniref:Glycosyltransferase 61 catalytic domain-containing protein n=1 Tax=Mycena venus TaxID=2733690 RepID=A0A8H7DAQ4_9AGAR|nr:hypothetical protein MVEN_00385600 [Mycena venus]